MVQKNELKELQLKLVKTNAQSELQKQQLKDEAKLQFALSSLKMSRKRVKSLLQDYNKVRLNYFLGGRILLSYVQTYETLCPIHEAEKSLEKIKTKSTALKLKVRNAVRLELELRAKLRDALAQTEETEIKLHEGRLNADHATSSSAQTVLDAIKEESFNSQLKVGVELERRC